MSVITNINSTCSHFSEHPSLLQLITQSFTWAADKCVYVNLLTSKPRYIFVCVGSRLVPEVTFSCDVLVRIATQSAIVARHYSPLQHPARQRPRPLRRHAGDRAHQRERPHIVSDDHRPLGTYGHLPTPRHRP